MGKFLFLPENFTLSRFLILLRSFAGRNDCQTVCQTNPTFEFRFISDFTSAFISQYFQTYRRVLAIETNHPQNDPPRFSRDKSQGDPAMVQVQERNLKRDPRISPQNPERSEELGEPRETLRDKRDLERSMESREIAGKPRNCRGSTEFRRIPRIRRSFDRDPSRSSNSSRKSPKK